MGYCEMSMRLKRRQRKKKDRSEDNFTLSPKNGRRFPLVFESGWMHTMPISFATAERVLKTMKIPFCRWELQNIAKDIGYFLMKCVIF